MGVLYDYDPPDAYEHAAEIMSLAGEDISEYEVPVDAWRKNYEYWKEQGEMESCIAVLMLIAIINEKLFKTSTEYIFTG